MTRPTYDLMARPCDQCLTSKDRIVPGKRAAQIIKSCRENNTKFICHKTRNVACRGVRDAIGPCRAERFGRAIGIEVVEIDPANIPEGLRQ